MTYKQIEASRELRLWVEWKVGRFMTRSCPYSSTKAFAQNWDLAYTT